MQKFRILRAYSTAASLPVTPTKVVYKKPRGALVGGLVTGFLLGLTAAGASSYWYLLDEYQRQALTLISSVDSVDRGVEKVFKSKLLTED